MTITVGRNAAWDSVLAMQLHVPIIDNTPITWLSAVKLYPYPGGFRIYIPGKVWKPASAEVTKVQLMGEFKYLKLGTTELYYLEIPKITKNILMRLEELK